jgi:hypothetical protein
MFNGNLADKFLLVALGETEGYLSFETARGISHNIRIIFDYPSEYVGKK